MQGDSSEIFSLERLHCPFHRESVLKVPCSVTSLAVAAPHSCQNPTSGYSLLEATKEQEIEQCLRKTVKALAMENLRNSGHDHMSGLKGNLDSIYCTKDP